MGERADRYRKKGYTVFGGGTFVERLEHDRLFGQEVFKEHGIPTPETWEVHDLAGVDAVLKSEFGKAEKLVIKLDGADMAGSSFSFVAKNPEMCHEQVMHWIDEGMLPGKWTGIIQRFVEGIEASCAGWWNGEEFSTIVLDLEEKKPFPGELGPAVGCAYNTLVRLDTSSKLYKQVLEPLGPLLKKHGYIGEIDTNSIIDASGKPHALEFTPRLGYDSTPTFAWGNNHGFFNKIFAILGMGDAPEFGYQGRVWAGVRVAIPPYPCESPDEKASAAFYESVAKNVPFLNYEDLADDFYPYDLKKTDEGKYVCTGAIATLGVAMGAGDDPLAASKAAYKVAERVQAPNKIFRALDGPRRAQKALEELLAMKLIRLYPELP